MILTEQTVFSWLDWSLVLLCYYANRGFVFPRWAPETVGSSWSLRRPRLWERSCIRKETAGNYKHSAFSFFFNSAICSFFFFVFFFWLTVKNVLERFLSAVLNKVIVMNVLNVVCMQIAWKKKVVHNVFAARWRKPRCVFAKQTWLKSKKTKDSGVCFSWRLEHNLMCLQRLQNMLILITGK